MNHNNKYIVNSSVWVNWWLKDCLRYLVPVKMNCYTEFTGKVLVFRLNSS